MSNEIATYKQGAVTTFTGDQLDLLKRTIAKDATDDELKLFTHQCQRTGLDPFTRQIYFIKSKKGQVTICTSIDGFRLIAERSGKYQGQTPAMWCGTDGVWKDVWTASTPPHAAKIGVWKENFKEPLYATALFKEYADYAEYDDNYGKFKKGDLKGNWKEMPAFMVAKVAEALALRKAFPNDLSGVYSDEEARLIDAKTGQQVTAAEAKSAGQKPDAKPAAASKAVAAPKPKDGADRLVTDEERKNLFAVARELGVEDKELQHSLKMEFNVDKSKDLKLSQYNLAINTFNSAGFDLAGWREFYAAAR